MRVARPTITTSAAAVARTAVAVKGACERFSSMLPSPPLMVNSRSHARGTRVRHGRPCAGQAQQAHRVVLVRAVHWRSVVVHAPSDDCGLRRAGPSGQPPTIENPSRNAARARVRTDSAAL